MNAGSEELDDGRRALISRLSLGFLASLPLLVAYEVGLASAGPEAGRNIAELILSRALAPLGDGQHPVRWVVLVILAAVALARVRLGPAELRNALGRTWLEGLVAALALGPILIGLVALIDVESTASFALPAEPGARASPSLERASRLFGAAVWEELLFRVGVYGLIYLLAVRLARFFGLGEIAAAGIADVCSLCGSSLVFAAFHLATFTRFFGLGGEVYDARVFLWRLLAGLLLAALVRWRGLGVAAWAHGLFNLALLLGANPGVFR